MCRRAFVPIMESCWGAGGLCLGHPQRWLVEVGLCLDLARAWVGALVRMDLGLSPAVMGDTAEVLQRLLVGEARTDLFPPLLPTAMEY